MNLPLQPPSSEEPEQQPALPFSEETPTEPSPASDSHSEETEQQPEHPAAEDIPTQPALSAESLTEETGPASSSEPLAEETESASSSESDEDETSAPDEDFEPDEDEASILDEDEAFESEQPARSGVFIQKRLLIGAAGAVVVVALLVALLVLVNRPKDPPTDWIASYIPPAGTTNTGKILYYLHWTNQNGELKGQLQLAAFTNGSLQSLTVPATGLYNRDNHIIYVVITINGQVDTLTGKINDNNDTLTLNPAGVTDQSSQFVFHIGSANDYKQATKKLGPVTK